MHVPCIQHFNKYLFTRKIKYLSIINPVFLFLESTEPSVYYINISVVNNYGYDVDVRSNSDTVQDVIVGARETYDITEKTNSPKSIVVRVYDRRDGIPIMVKGERYVKISPRSSPQYVQRILLKPGKSRLLNFYNILESYKELELLYQRNIITPETMDNREIMILWFL